MSKISDRKKEWDKVLETIWTEEIIPDTTKEEYNAAVLARIKSAVEKNPDAFRINMETGHKEPSFHVEPSKYATRLQKLDFYVSRIHDYIVRNFLC